MERMFDTFGLGNLELANRFVFPPIKLGYGNPDGTVTDRQLNFYRQIARSGPGLVIIEPVSVTADGREHPKQPCVHLPESTAELKKIVNVIHGEGRLASLHLNHTPPHLYEGLRSCYPPSALRHGHRWCQGSTEAYPFPNPYLMTTEHHPGVG